jgi:hypothetical protein
MPFLHQLFQYHKGYHANLEKTWRHHGSDWSGQTAAIKNNMTGQSIPAYVFVADLPCSQYAHVEAFLSMDIDSWILAHIHAFEYLEALLEWLYLII